MTRLLVACFSLLALSACSKASLLNATITRDGYAVKRDFAYGENPRQRFDLYIPHGVTKAPVIVFYYGGSWQSGSKDDYRFLGQAFAEKGFITAVADYRLYPEVKFPEFIEDGARAFAYIHAHADAWGGDPARVYVAGHSAGAYIAMMVGADPQYVAATGGQRSDVRGIIGIAGPYDFLPFTDDDIQAIFSTASDAATQPINHLISPMPPVFLASGNSDDVVDPRNSLRVEAKLKSMESKVVAYHYPDTGHIGIILSLAQGFRGRTSLLEDVADFITQH
ncbi:MAG: alpha/beta hydrolase [Rickettsiales bacterium]